MTTTPTEADTVTSRIKDGLSLLVTFAGVNSAEHGFHENWPVDIDLINPGRDRDLQLAIIEKLDLIHEEVSEALGEIRSGHEPGKVYYSKKTKEPTGSEIIDYHHEQLFDGDTPRLKPEGFGIELADAMIRIADLAYLTGIDLPAAVLEKARYNATRPYKHGRTL